MIAASPAEIELIVKILAPSFETNLSVNRCIKQDHKQFQRIENQIRYVSRLSLRDQMAFVNEYKTGALLCNLSDGAKATPLDDLFYITRVSGIKLGLKLMQREKMLKQFSPTIPYCHLWFIGVDKKEQGHGLGTKMLDALKNICKERKLPIYLETSNPQNLKFYERNGFEVYHEAQLPMDNFKLYFYKWNFK